MPEARYNLTGKPFNMLPGPAGAHAWQPMAYHPDTGYVYIPATDMWSIMANPDNDYVPTRGRPNAGTGGIATTQRYYAEHPEAPRGFVSRLIAFDPVTGREAWSAAGFSAGHLWGAVDGRRACDEGRARLSRQSAQSGICRLSRHRW